MIFDQIGLNILSHFPYHRIQNEVQYLHIILLDYPELGYAAEDVVPMLGNAGDLMIFDTDLFHMGGAVKENNKRLIIRGHTR